MRVLCLWSDFPELLLCMYKSTIGLYHTHTHSFSSSRCELWALKPSFSSRSLIFWATSLMLRLSLLYLRIGENIYKHYKKQSILISSLKSVTICIIWVTVCSGKAKHSVLTTENLQLVSPQNTEEVCGGQEDLLQVPKSLLWQIGAWQRLYRKANRNHITRSEFRAFLYLSITEGNGTQYLQVVFSYITNCDVSQQSLCSYMLPPFLWNKIHFPLQTERFKSKTMEYLFITV